ncbi:HAD-IIIC family phosphatase [Rhodobacter maris]|uniref:HAD superfamily phosphatase (TIGR01681 family)/FkbH-like protein n=1 Tax=Rhodobacter maris TaxID=446682 RepID=A0A285S648_9RHOB|nr:HAD-IIIC family phosphatase [Rhodobacter maris]SOC02854.1 HAD superfamily phosphatase (TIGR01681 family)/FkbH-like protein [Rhodobacter maris]
MNAEEFLFPRALEVRPSKISKVLVLGSCMAEETVAGFRRQTPNTEFDLLVFNGPGDLPDLSKEAVLAYDFQYVQLSLRYIVRDEVVRFADFQQPGVAESVMERSLQFLRVTLEAALAYNRAHGLLTFVTNFFVPQVPVVAALDRAGSSSDFASIVRRLNEELARLVATCPNAYIADVDMVASACGKRFLMDDTFTFYSHSHFWSAVDNEFDISPEWNAPAWGRLDPVVPLEDIYAGPGGDVFCALWRQAECLYRIVNQTDMVKMVIFDLDDTLWRGQIVEHYGPGIASPVFHGWPVGMWEAIQHLRARGIITAVCSKNEESLVRERWHHAVMPSWLTLDDFAIVEIGWTPKAEVIGRMISRAGLTPKSVVFVDDNPVEREAVRAALPGIRVLGDSPNQTRRILLWSPETQLATLSNETVNRETSIRQIQHREQDRETLSREEFLRDLNCRVRLVRVPSTAHRDGARCLELLNKTNQFNTTGLRWTAAQLDSVLASGGTLYGFYAQDRYTDYGLVGVVIYREGIFVQFAMSCRVLGLSIEQAVIREIMADVRLREPGREFGARIFATDSNLVSRDVFLKCGFRALETDQTVQVAAGGTEVAAPAHVALTFELSAAA